MSYAEIVQGWQKLSLPELAAKMATLPPQIRDKIVEEAYIATRSMKWIPNSGPQTLAYLSPADLLLYGGMAAGGKLQPLDAKVLTPMGWRLMGDLSVGDVVSDPTTGGHTRIIAVHEHVEQQIYRVTCDDGATTEVGADHLWAFCIPSALRPRTKQSDQRAYARSVLSSPEPRDRWHALRVGNTYELMSILKKKQSPRIPLCEPVLFTVNGRAGHGAMPPYLAGLMLGDGHSASLSMTSCDDEVRDYLITIGFKGTTEIHSDGRPKGYASTGSIRKAMDAWLRNHGLRHCRSWEKFIPDYVFTADIKYRLDFLSGLMDTDGTVDTRGHPSFTSTSERLARGVADLVRGFGGKATITSRIPTYSHMGEKKDGRLAYTLYIWLPNAAPFFRILRKKQRCTWEWGGGADNMRAIVSIEKSKFAPARCITLDSPYGLYITDDYIVTHNSDLILGLALTAHQRSLILRQQYNDLDALTERALEILGTRRGYNGSNPPSLKTEDGRFIQFSGATMGQWQGHAFDLKCADEVTQIAEEVVRFHIGWVRSVKEGQRTRVVLGSNPPVNSVGDWIIPMFRPWLDPTHPNPAHDGELRWFVRTPDGDEIEVDDSKPIQFPGQDTPTEPMSRTFIRARLQDNPFLVNTDYRKKLDQMDEPFRSAMRDGNFMAARRDQTDQVIPTAWVIEAQKRWTKGPPKDVRMSAIAIDVGGGGLDRVVVAIRYGVWYAPLIVAKGKDAPDGSSQAALIARHRRDNCPVVVDVGGGYGGDITSVLKGNGVTVSRFNGSESASSKTRDGSGRGFENRRAEAWWRFREALNPDQKGGSVICLPDDMELRSELTSVCFKDDTLDVQLEDKKHVKKRLGRSPDKADAVVMAFSPGESAMRRQAFAGQAGGRPTHSNVGYSSIKRR